MQGQYLYIDHQSLAPLIHALEDVIEYQYQESKQEFQKYQLRKPIYQQFVTILNTVFIENRGDIKIEAVKWEDQLEHIDNIEVNQSRALNSKWTRQQQQGERDDRVRTRGKRNLQIQIMLIEWMLGCDRNVFQKREVVQKYNQLFGGRKKHLTISKILSIMEKYKLWNVIIRDKQGQEHFLNYDQNTSVATIVKRQEFSKEMSRIIQEQDHHPTQLWPDLPRNIIAEEGSQFSFEERKEEDQEEDLKGYD